METATLSLRDVAEQVVLDRRQLHMHPEIRFEEHETARFVAERLRRLGIATRTGLGGTGVLGTIVGGRPAALCCCAPTWTPCPCRRRTTYPTARPCRA